MPAPLHLALNDLRFERPVMGLAAAQGTLDLGEDYVCELIEVRALLAWDIASPGARRRELRILVASVREYQAAHRRGIADPLFRCSIPAPAAVAAVLPAHSRPWITSPEVQRCLQCGSTHVIGLIEAKCLSILPGSTYRRGPNGAALVGRDSLSQFLTARFES